MAKQAKIKICGIRTAAALEAAIRARADHVGFVFFAKSPRAVTPREAAALAAVAGPRISRIGLFVDADAVLTPLLRGLAASAEAGATPRERMLAVCRIAIAHVATWLKPATKEVPGAKDEVGALWRLPLRLPASSLTGPRSKPGRASHPARGAGGRGS